MDDVIDPNASLAVAMTSLDWCARSRQVSLLQAVLRAHFLATPISSMQRECSHLLRNAVTSGCHMTVTSLLEHVDKGFLLERLDGGDGRTRVDKLLGVAVELGHRTVADVLLSRGGNPNCWYRGQPVLHMALSIGHHDLALTLLDAGADPHLVNSKGETAIFPALSNDSDRALEVVNRLITEGADVNYCSLTGRQPVHVAALSSSPACLARLLDTGCDASARDGVQGDTPLHLACSRCCQPAIVTLIQHGAQFNCANRRGQTPLRKLLQHATRVQRDFHSKLRLRVARTLVTIGFRLHDRERPLHGPKTDGVNVLGGHPGVSAAEGHVAKSNFKPNVQDLSVFFSHSQIDIVTNVDDSQEAEMNEERYRFSSQQDQRSVSYVDLVELKTSKEKPKSHRVSQRELPFIALLESFSEETVADSPKSKPGTSAHQTGTQNHRSKEDTFTGSLSVGRLKLTSSEREHSSISSTRPQVSSYKRGCLASASNGLKSTSSAKERSVISTSRPAVTSSNREYTSSSAKFLSNEIPRSPPNFPTKSCRRDKVAGLVQTLTGELSRGVTSLQHYCRLEIRRHLPAVHFQQAVSRLDIAPHLQHYLMFRPCLVDHTVCPEREN